MDKRTAEMIRAIAEKGHGENSPAGDVAVYSPCQRYRYLLFRDRGDPPLGVIMLNPSTATAFKDDPTIRRLRTFAGRWGFGQLIIANLFGYRSPHPSRLKEIDDPVGELNDDALGIVFGLAETILVAWGGHPAAATRLERLGEIAAASPGPVNKLICLKRTQSGAPIHPMARGRNRVPDDATPEGWGPL